MRTLETETKAMKLLGRECYSHQELEGQGGETLSLQKELALMTPDFSYKTQFGLLASRTVGI